MIKRIVYIIFIFFMPAYNLNAQDTTPKFQTNRNFNFELEYYQPKDLSRNIKSVFAYSFWGREFINELHYSIYGGLITSFTWGNTLHWDANFVDRHYDASSIGIGPASLIRVDFLRFGRFNISGDFMVGIILYNKHFPDGGDIYNFMRKYGVTFGANISKDFDIDIGIRDMHISNGQGLGPQNPSYEGWGVSLDFIKHLK